MIVVAARRGGVSQLAAVALRAAADGRRPGLDGRAPRAGRRRARSVRAVRGRDLRRHRRRLRHPSGAPLSGARRRRAGDRRAGAGHSRRRRDHAARLRHADHLVLSAAALDRPRLRRQRRRAGRRVGAGAAGAARCRDARMSMRAAALIPGVQRSRHHRASRRRHPAVRVAGHRRGRRVDATDGGARARRPAPRCFAHAGNRGQGTRGAHRAGARAAQATSRTCCCSTATCSICRTRRARLLDAAGAPGADRRDRRAAVQPERCRRRATTPTGSAAARCRGSSACRSATRSAASACFASTRCGRLRLTAPGYEIETEMLVKVRRRGGRVTSVPVTAVYAGQRSKLRPIRDTTRTCFLAVYYRFLERL